VGFVKEQTSSGVTDAIFKQCEYHNNLIKYLLFPIRINKSQTCKQHHQQGEEGLREEQKSNQHTFQKKLTRLLSFKTKRSPRLFFDIFLLKLTDFFGISFNFRICGELFERCGFLFAVISTDNFLHLTTIPLKQESNENSCVQKYFILERTAF
jgi:hypothetical protein